MFALVVAKITGEYIDAGGDYEPDLKDGSWWPWCDACRSYHHRDNPTCKLRRDS